MSRNVTPSPDLLEMICHSTCEQENVGIDLEGIGITLVGDASKRFQAPASACKRFQAPSLLPREKFQWSLDTKGGRLPEGPAATLTWNLLKGWCRVSQPRCVRH